MTAANAEAIAVALGGWHGKRPAKGNRGWMCKCPAHDDNGPSLSITNGNDGRLLLHCFAGCTYAEVRDALIRRGLLAENDNQPRRRPPPFRVPPGGLLMLQNVIEDDRVLSAAWSTGDTELFESRFTALKQGCDGPDMAARCSILDLGPDLHGFVCALFGTDR
jgi:hypothetical protein